MLAGCQAQYKPESEVEVEGGEEEEEEEEEEVEEDEEEEETAEITAPKPPHCFSRHVVSNNSFLIWTSVGGMKCGKARFSFTLFPKWPETEIHTVCVCVMDAVRRLR